MARTVLILFLSISFLAGCESAQIQMAGKPFHHTNKGFRNPPGSIEPVGFAWDDVKFFMSVPFMSFNSPAIPDNHVLDQDEALRQLKDAEGADSITWIGHMTVIIKLGGQVIAIDPWFSQRASPFSFIGPKRFVPPGIELSKLPQINTVVLTHNHYDHMDLATLERLPNRDQITIIVPLKVSRYFKHISFKKVIELDWYESAEVDNLRYIALPAVHFSGRGALDSNKTLWAAWSIEGPNGKKVFFSESDYGAVFKQIGEKYGPFDIALISNGAYLPRSVMQGYHALPDMAVQIGLDVGAENLVPVHWGTVRLSSENVMESGKLFLDEALKKQVAEKRVWLMKIGETRKF